MARLFSLASLAIVALLVGAASAYTFEIDQIWPWYEHEDYRPIPSWRIGIWDKESVPAKASPKSLSPHVDVQLKIVDYEGRFAQFVIYPIGRVERDLYGGTNGVHPCMDQGQEWGIADKEAIEKKGGMVLTTYPVNITVSETGYRTEVQEFNAHADVTSTGFFAFTVLFCRFVWVDPANRWTGPYHTVKPITGADNWIRILDQGNNKTRVTGTVKVVNPYGEAPGQAYGFVPFYAIFFTVLLLLMLVLGIRMACAGSQKVVMYHWCIIGAVALSLWAAIFFVAYIGEINERDVDKPGIYIAGYLFVRIRDDFARICMTLIFSGLGIIRGKINNKEIVMVIVYGVLYFIMGIVKVIATETSGQRVVALAAVTRMHPGPREWGTIVIDFILNFAIAIAMIYYFKTTLVKIEKQSPRRNLYIGTFVLTVFYVLIGFFFGLATIADSQFNERVREENWKAWWFEAAFMDMLFGICLIFLVIIWFPRDRTMNLLGGSYTDDARYGDGQQANGAAPVPGAAAGQPGAPNPKASHVDYGDQEMKPTGGAYGGGSNAYSAGASSNAYSAGSAAGGSAYGGGGSGVYGGGAPSGGGANAYGGGAGSNAYGGGGGSGVYGGGGGGNAYGGEKTYGGGVAY